MVWLGAALSVALAGWCVTVHLFLRYVTQLAQDASIERAQLLQRIQAPDLAVFEHGQSSEVGSVGSVSIFDDEAYWQSEGFEPKED